MFCAIAIDLEQRKILESDLRFSPPKSTESSIKTIFKQPNLLIIEAPQRPLQHIYIYSCKNSTIGLIIMRLTALIIRALQNRPKLLKCIVY